MKRRGIAQNVILEESRFIGSIHRDDEESGGIGPPQVSPLARPFASLRVTEDGLAVGIRACPDPPQADAGVTEDGLAILESPGYLRDLKKARISSTSISGSSRAAKWPPLGISVQRWTL